MNQKTYAVIGLGKFGFYVAKGLAEQGVNVIAIDHTSERTKVIKEFVESVYILDSTDIHALREAGIINVDVAIVSIGANIEASILTVMALKDLGNKLIIAKAVTPIHGEILAKIGAFKVIYPEREAAKRLVRDFVQHPAFELIDISNTIKVAKILATHGVVGKSIAEIEQEASGKIHIIAHKSNGKWNMKPAQESRLKEGDLFSALGEARNLEDFYHSWGS